MYCLQQFTTLWRPLPRQCTINQNGSFSNLSNLSSTEGSFLHCLNLYQKFPPPKKTGGRGNALSQKMGRGGGGGTNNKEPQNPLKAL